MGICIISFLEIFIYYDKLIPFNTNHSTQYYDIYFNCILTLLKDYFLLINDYNTEVKVDVTKLNQINFIEIKDS